MKAFLIFIAIVVSFAIPASAMELPPRDTVAIDRFFKKLRALPNGASSYTRIRRLTLTLGRLDPIKAAKYYKTALTKMSRSQKSKNDAKELAHDLTKIVEKSDLSDAQKAKIIKNLDRDEDPCFCPTPTPAPESP
jgi:hypothetical protein